MDEIQIQVNLAPESAVVMLISFVPELANLYA